MKSSMAFLLLLFEAIHITGLTPYKSDLRIDRHVLFKAIFV